LLTAQLTPLLFLNTGQPAKSFIVLTGSPGLGVLACVGGVLPVLAPRTHDLVPLDWVPDQLLSDEDLLAVADCGPMLQGRLARRLACPFCHPSGIAAAMAWKWPEASQK
jgi:hypothetical protein